MLRTSVFVLALLALAPAAARAASPDERELETVARLYDQWAPQLENAGVELAVFSTQSKYKLAIRNMREHLDRIRAQGDARVREARARVEALEQRLAERTAAVVTGKSQSDHARHDAIAADQAKAQLYFEFIRDASVATPSERSRAVLLVRLERASDAGYIGRLEDLVTAIATLAKVETACAGKYLGMTNPPGRKFERPEEVINDAELWCQAAPHRQELARRSVMNLMARGHGEAEWYDKQTKNLEAQEGFLTIEDAWEEQAVSDLPALKARMVAENKPFLDAAGMPADALDFALVDDLHAKLWAEIERLAPRWTFPDARAHHASEALALQAIAAAHAGAKVLQHGMESAQYELDDDQEARSWKGWVLFQVPGEKWCRLQSFLYIELFRGGTFHRATSVRLGFPRMQACR